MTFARNPSGERDDESSTPGARGEIARLIINVPPRSLKSHSASIAFPAWILGHDPAAQAICVSYAQDLAEKMARDCRALMQGRFYQRLFPTRLSPQKQSVAEFVITGRDVGYVSWRFLGLVRHDTRPDRGGAGPAYA